MIESILIKENLGFKQAKLDLEAGLTVFTGLSGAGKSVLFKAILAAFALSESEAKMVEILLNDELELDEFGIENEELNVFKLLKDKSSRYFINNQLISKKNLALLSKKFVKYLSAKENNEFSNERFLNLLDFMQSKEDKKFQDFLNEYKNIYKEYMENKTKLEKIQEEEKKVEELKEFTSFEIQKIQSINPKIGEFDELMSFKKRLSKKDKIDAAWNRASRIFELESAVIEALQISDVDSSFFSECLNELRAVWENQSFDDFDFDIEEVLDRIEKLSSLISKYGSIEEALEALEKKKAELAHYENLSFEKKELEEKVQSTKILLDEKSQKLSTLRKKRLKELEKLLNFYLEKLYMKEVKLELKDCALSILGKDEVSLNINEASLKNLSSGEINRLRLSFIATECNVTNKASGIIFLDEIDANLSGKEAMSIAEVLKELAKFYQIFAISHLPQLSSKASNHFLVEKIGNESRVRKIEKEERVRELARMVSGENITQEALEFTRTLL
ncbi:DNA recombination protein RecN [Campylobacter lari]|uniref:AAA family ATPase n=1 Tax=unclassified Campylobacter TaxID=2593542 RepID=UPI0012803C3F|nr:MULTISPECIES: AAA family ATPase [unclassified Campylobacter]EAI7262757.1 DNA recombination protein RecN [Campylobacter lari]EAK0436185.1 DNA recombination protein RecN [Campylobacter lari]EAK0804556.1 DNA recombination protein RecN [Campylobacter lari]EAL9772241.1 DNA recombination protein RecN [Campylobacter lari]EGK7523213.1 DNA recombination protein RecN [Campylobacter lari]